MAGVSKLFLKGPKSKHFWVLDYIVSKATPDFCCYNTKPPYNK